MVENTRIIWEDTPADAALQSMITPWHGVSALTKPPIIWLLGDGKPGHENQSLGLTDAIARRMPCEVHRISLAGERGIFKRVKAAERAGIRLPAPDLIIGAGHSTHFALLWLARKHGAKSIVLMKPSLPMGWFDLCIVPAHDFKAPPQRENVIVTQGALNRVAPPENVDRTGRMILIGGPSGAYGWDEETLLQALAGISTEGKWQLTDSRRTPDGFIRKIEARLPGIEIFPHQNTRPEWLPGKLARAEEVWVTEDSVSMVYEALSSGARVGLLPVPRAKKDSRVLRGLEVLISNGFLTSFTEWEKTKKLNAPPSILREADRCAGEVVRRFFS